MHALQLDLMKIQGEDKLINGMNIFKERTHADNLSKRSKKNQPEINFKIHQRNSFCQIPVIREPRVYDENWVAKWDFLRW